MFFVFLFFSFGFHILVDSLTGMHFLYEYLEYKSSCIHIWALYARFQTMETGFEISTWCIFQEWDLLMLSFWRGDLSVSHLSKDLETFCD